MAPTPGVVRIWDGTQAVIDPRPVPKEGLEIGRAQLGNDDTRMSSRHARVVLDEVGLDTLGILFRVTDLGSRNGTYVDGERVEDARAISTSSTLSIGSSVFLLVNDIAPYAGTRLEQRHGLDVGASLRPALRAVEEAALVEDNVLIRGPRGSPKRELARAYASLRGRPSLVYSRRAAGRPLESVLTAPIATVIIEDLDAMTAQDHATLAEWLETDVRFVTVAVADIRDHREQRGVPAGLPARLLGRTIEVPSIDQRRDEAAALVRRTAAPELAVHWSVVERAVRTRWRYDAEELAAAISNASERALQRNGSTLRVQDLPAELENAQVTFAAFFTRVMGEPPPFPIPDECFPVILHQDSERMIASNLRGEVMLVSAQAGAIDAHAEGWFQAGFWGHGVNSYSLYFSEVTDRMRVYLRMPYGAGAYCSDPERERRRALEILASYEALKARDDVARATLVDGGMRSSYELVLADGRVIRDDDVTCLYDHIARFAAGDFTVPQ